MVNLERETRVELATLCLGSTGWVRHITSVVEHLPPRQMLTSGVSDLSDSRSAGMLWQQRCLGLSQECLNWHSQDSGQPHEDLANARRDSLLLQSRG